MTMKKNIKIKRTDGINFLQKYLHPILIIGISIFCSVTHGQSNPEGTDSLKYLSGIVRDANTKEPIAAAQIQTLNHMAAATTDENGAFKIQIFSSSEVLLVNAFDYNSREIAVRGRQSIEIDLYPDDFEDIYPVEEELTGPVRSAWSTNSVKGINNVGNPDVVSFDDVIQSHMGGDVRAISRSGVEDMGYSLFIRGINSININAQPLFVVDGVIWNNFYDNTSLHDGFFNNTLAAIDLIYSSILLALNIFVELISTYSILHSFKYRHHLQ